MSVTYAATNNYGPCFPNVSSSLVTGQPTTPAAPEGSPLNTDNTNTNRSQLAVQTYMVTDQKYTGTPPGRTFHSGNDPW